MEYDSKYIGVTTLTFWGHMMSLVMWPFDHPFSISYRRSIVTDSLSPAVFEILGPKDIGVTTLTFQGQVKVIGHVTIRLHIPLFLLVPHCDQTSISTSFRDIGLQNACPVQIVIAHARYQVTCTPYAKFGYIFEFPTPTLPFHYDTFIGLRWRIRGVYSWDPQCYARNRAKIF